MLKNLLITVSLSVGMFGIGLVFAPSVVEQVFHAEANLRLPITFFGSLALAAILLPPLFRKEAGEENFAAEVALRLCWVILAFLVGILWESPEVVNQFNYRLVSMIYGISLVLASMAVSVRAWKQNWLQQA